MRSLALTNHARVRRPADARLLKAAIERVPCTVADLDRFLAESGVEHGVGRATIAWMLKYDLLRVADASRTAGGLDR